MMYASKTPRDLPEREFEGNTFFPAQHNGPNPILVAFRVKHYPAGYWAHRLGNGDLPVAVSEASPGEIDHARRVLSRLAALS